MANGTLPVWDLERDNWSTTQSAVFFTPHPERFSESEQANIRQGEGGWVTVPEGALTPDCEPHPDLGGACACGRGPDGWVGPDKVAERLAAEQAKG